MSVDIAGAITDGKCRTAYEWTLLGYAAGRSSVEAVVQEAWDIIDKMGAGIDVDERVYLWQESVKDLKKST